MTRNYLICFISLYFFMHVADPAKAQPNKTSSSTAAKKDETCGCDYLPLCNPDETKNFGGKSYKGFRDDDGDMVWYNCDNGVVTKKWQTAYNEIGYDKTTDPFNNKTVETYYEGATKYQMHTVVILKYNAPERTVWSQGFDSWKIMKKGLTLTVDGKTYNDVIKVHYQDKSPELTKKSAFYYYGKGVGFLKEEKASDEERMYSMLEELESDLVAQGKLEGIVDSDLIGHWINPARPGYDEKDIHTELRNGTGMLYRETEQLWFGDVSGKRIKREVIGFFIWRVDEDGLKYRYASVPGEIEDVEVYKLEKTLYPKTSTPALKLNQQYHKSADKYSWKQVAPNNTQPVNTVAKTPVVLKGRIDESVVGRWVCNVVFFGSKYKWWLTLKADGTFERTDDRSTNIAKGEWRIDGDHIEFLENGQVDRKKLQKVNDPKTGKPLMRVGFEVSINIYESLDNKKPW